MYKLYSFTLFICILLHSEISASPENIVRNFQAFSEELLNLSADSEEATDTRPGVKLYNPFGIGYLLANVNEQLWNISNTGIPEALRTHKNFVPDDFGYLLGQFKKSKFKITSTIYSRYENVTKTPAYNKLLSHLITLDFVSKPVEFVDSFSSLLDVATKGHLDNELLPKALWEKVFDNSTQGAYINTLYYKTKWAKPWVDIGERSFNYDAIVKFLETDGEFRVFQNANMTAVIVPLQQVPSQQIVFVKPHIYIPMDRLRNEIRGILGSNSSWPLMQLRLQIPALNITNLSRHNLAFPMMGINETFCQANNETDFDGNSTTASETFVQQPIAQASHFEFAPTFIEFASGTGSSVGLPQEQAAEPGLEEEYEDDYAMVSKDGPEPDEPALRTAGLQFHRALDNVQKSDGKCEKPEEFSGSHRISQTVIHDAEGKATLIFDTPFTWILEDAGLGETFSGSVSSLCQYRKVVDAIQTNSAHAWLHDVFKVAFWKCV